ncbi:MAG: hypothetical protein E7555_02775 [Ruminococcaceae bacterium]|nr:hypothetical protein [Oscillospiraceae bacterium]
MNWLWHGSTDVVFKTDTERKKDKLKKSILIFFGSAVFVVLVAAFFLMLSYDFDISNVIGSGSGEVMGENNSFVVKKVKGEENILMYCTDDDEKKVTFLVAVRFDMTEKEIKVLPISVKDKIFTFNTKKVNASKCFSEAGELQLVKSAETYMGIEFDKYIGCKEGSVEGITANFQPLQMEFEKDMTFKRDSDTVVFEEGTHELSDDAVVKLLTYSSGEGENEFRGEVLLQMFRQYFNETSVENRNIIYSNIISQTDSNISIVDFTSYKDCIVVLSSDSVKKKYIVCEDISDFKE